MAKNETPQCFDDAASLEEFMSRPTKAIELDLQRLDGDIIVLGVSGKMGPTLALLAKRAAPAKRVIGVARFTDRAIKHKLENWGIETIECDLLNSDSVDSLPKARNVIFLVGRKFRMAGSEALTWATNAITAANAAKSFSSSRIIALSTGCVYPLVDVAGDGAMEDMPMQPPPSDYTMSCVGRERIFEYYGGLFDTGGRIIRLSYAIDMRYGVLHDIASAVYRGEPINISSGYVNVIWQGDANNQILRSLIHCTPTPTPLNVSGLQKVCIKDLAMSFGRLFDRDVVIEGEEDSKAWLVNTKKAFELFGEPQVSLDEMVKWTAEWVTSHKQSYGKATKFDVRDGKY